MRRPVGTGASGVATGHQSCSRGCAERADMKVGEAQGLGMQPVEVRGIQRRVAVSGKVAIALVIGHDQDDVRRHRQRDRGQQENEDSTRRQHRYKDSN